MNLQQKPQPSNYCHTSTSPLLAQPFLNLLPWPFLSLMLKGSHSGV